MENWFKYRLPGAEKPVSGASPRVTEGLGDGFVIAPFQNPETGLITIPRYEEPKPCDITPYLCSLAESTPKEAHQKEVEQIVRSLGGAVGKTVASRTLKISCRIDLNATFENLCASYPDAFVFMFSTPGTGTWIGASPELLLKEDGRKLRTMALAGTRKAESDGNWDLKNIEEQRMVADFIRDILSSHCEQVETGTTHTLKAGAVEHICTPISAIAPDHGESKLSALKRILCDLSPTPAVCGSDRRKSMQTITETEKHSREMYGGFCGPCGIAGDTAFFVNLRCAKCSDTAICLYAGGGITRLSDPEAEWQETEIKTKTIINKLKTI